MNEDYSFIDQYIQNSLDNYRKQVFGEYDDNTGYFNEVTPEDDTEENSVSDSTDDEVYNDDNTQQPSEEDIYSSLFPEDNIGIPMDRGRPLNSSPGQRPGFRSFSTYQEGKQALLDQLKLYQTGKSKTGIKPDTTLLGAMSIYAPSSDGNNPKHYAEVVAKHVGATINTPISKIDTNKWAEAIEKMEGNKVGNNPGNLRYQTGGTPIARTRQQQFIGLNDDALDQLILPLNGENTIRGLDSYKPVLVKDSKGNSRILHGPEDIMRTVGKVYETRIKS